MLVSHVYWCNTSFISHKSEVYIAIRALRTCVDMPVYLFFFKAIEAMKNAHRTELEKELDKARKAHSNTENADIDEIRRQHE